MFSAAAVIAGILLYMGCLFLIALYIEGSGDRGRRLVAHPAVYSLSLAIYASAWTFYGSVGRTATSGMLFLAIYLGPTLAFVLGWVVLRKLVRIKNDYRITSIADLVSTRYGKSQALAALVTVVALVGIIPYISLQLQAILSTFAIITVPGGAAVDRWISAQLGFIIVGLLFAFTIVIGVRRLAPAERHEGMIMALSVECVVKLAAFLLVGVFVTYGLFAGFGDILSRVAASRFSGLLSIGGGESTPYITWFSYLVLSMLAVMFLPRQFHVAVVENVDERQIRTAMWLFPLYMLLINIFIFPVAAGGLLLGFPVVQADTFVLRLPIDHGSRWLALATFIGGFSAATGMVMVESMALSTMITNHLLLPLMGNSGKLSFLRGHLLKLRWAAVAVVLGLGYWFRQQTGQYYYTLVNIGMISFSAVAQFAPVLLGGIFWRRANKAGAFMGLSAGILVWFYTLFLPNLIEGGMPTGDIAWPPPLLPYQLFGLSGLDPVSHTLFWSMFFNIGFFLFGSLYFRQGDEEKDLADSFVSALAGRTALHRAVRREALIDVNEKKRQIEELLGHYFPQDKAAQIAGTCLRSARQEGLRRINTSQLLELLDAVERSLAASIGAASAHEAVRRQMMLSEPEARELADVYAETLAELRLTPEELHRRIDAHREREELLLHQARELEERIRERDEQMLERRKAEQALMDSEEKYRAIFENSGNALIIVEDDMTISKINTEFMKLTGRTAAAVEGRMRWPDFASTPEDARKIRHYHRLRAVDPHAVPSIFEVCLKHATESPRDVAAAVTMLPGTDRSLVALLDVTERKRAEDRIRYISFHDSVTGLYNRAYFEEEVRRLDTERSLPLSIIMGDVNNLKLVNDAFGHDEGDRLLRKMSEVLRESCRNEDIIARWGGDEFVVILPRTDTATAAVVRDRICSVAGTAEGPVIQTSIALGLATKSEREQNVYQTIRRAEERMYANKLEDIGRNRRSVLTSLIERARANSGATQEHAERSRALARRFAGELRLGDTQVRDLELLCELHDIGMAAIPARLIAVKGTLSRSAREEVEKHAEIGFRIVKVFPGTSRIADEVLSHGERWDGSGYPRGLKGAEIPFLVRVFSVVDAYDVMTHERPYARALSRGEALAELERNAGSQFDPGMVAAFTRMAGAGQPVGSPGRA